MRPTLLRRRWRASASSIAGTSSVCHAEQTGSSRCAWPAARAGAGSGPSSSRMSPRVPWRCHRSRSSAPPVLPWSPGRPPAISPPSETAWRNSTRPSTPSNRIPPASSFGPVASRPTRSGRAPWSPANGRRRLVTVPHRLGLRPAGPRRSVILSQTRVARAKRTSDLAIGQLSRGLERQSTGLASGHSRRYSHQRQRHGAGRAANSRSWIWPTVSMRPLSNAASCSSVRAVQRSSPDSAK